MQYWIRQEDITEFHMYTFDWFDRNASCVARMEKAAEMFVGMDSFRGDAASHLKSYLSEVHFVLALGFLSLMDAFVSCLILYEDRVYGIDGSLYAQIHQDTLIRGAENYHRLFGDLTGECGGALQNAGRMLQSLGSAESTALYSQCMDGIDALSEEYKRVIQEMNSLDERIIRVEQEATNGFKTFDCLASALRGFLAEQLETGRVQTGYMLLL